MSGAGHFGERSYDRWFLLGEKRTEQLSLPEVRQYGLDSFGEPDYVRVHAGPARQPDRP